MIRTKQLLQKTLVVHTNQNKALQICFIFIFEHLTECIYIYGHHNLTSLKIQITKIQFLRNAVMCFGQEKPI